MSSIRAGAKVQGCGLAPRRSGETTGATGGTAGRTWTQSSPKSACKAGPSRGLCGHRRGARSLSAGVTWVLWGAAQHPQPSMPGAPLSTNVPKRCGGSLGATGWTQTSQHLPARPAAPSLRSGTELPKQHGKEDPGQSARVKA